MNWKSFGTRIAMVSVALPLLGVVIFLLPWQRHLVLTLLVAAVSVVGSLEVVGLLSARGIPVARRLAPALAGTLPIAAWVQAAGYLPGVELHLLWTAAAAGVLLVAAILFLKKAALRPLLASVGASLLALLYPGFFLSFVSRMTGLTQPGLTVAFFLCVIFGDDMLAYFVGSLWGASSCLHLPVSPNKSAVGFVGGVAGAVIVTLLFHWLAGGFPNRGLGPDIAIAAGVGIVGIVGDLVESGLKRSAGVKDSGVIIPGRGGILDSVDSLLLAAPLFYLLLTVVPAAR